MIDINSLNLKVNRARILADLSLKCNNGEIIGIIGPPGSGKTTMLRAIAGLVKGYSGEISIEGKTLSRSGKRRRASLVTFSGKSFARNRDDILYNFLLLSRIPFKKMLRPFSDYDIQVTEQYMTLFDLDRVSLKSLNSLSDSTLKRSHLAHACIRESHALLLDNPTDELDIGSLRLIRRALSHYAINGNRIVIMASNDLSFISQTVDRVLVLERGRIVIDSTPEILTARMVKKYFGTDVIISHNVYTGRPDIHFFPEN